MKCLNVILFSMSIGSPHSQAVDSAVGAALEHVSFIVCIQDSLIFFFFRTLWLSLQLEIPNAMLACPLQLVQQRQLHRQFTESRGAQSFHHLSFNPCRVTVMASDSQDSFTDFSNFGKCTTIIAPASLCVTKCASLSNCYILGGKH